LLTEISYVLLKIPPCQTKSSALYKPIYNIFSLHVLEEKMADCR